MPKNYLLAILIILISLFTGFVGGFAFLNYRTKPMTHSSQQPVTNYVVPKQNTMQNSKAITLPIRNDLSNVEWFNLSYGIRTKLLGVREISQGVELVTDIKEDGLPQFIVTPSTRITLNTVDAKSADLKPNQKVLIYFSYETKLKKMTTTRVNIEK